MAEGILLVGGSGLIGRQVLPLLLRQQRDAQVFAAQRKPPAFGDPRLQPIVGELQGEGGEQRIASAIRAAGVRLDTLICCLGTTRRAAGSDAAFAAVDRDLVLRVAQLARKLGAQHALLVSSVGAAADSRNFYLRVKGEAETGIAALGFTRCDFLRPGLLRGARDEHRPGEALAQRLAPLLDPLLIGALQRYRSITAADVAAALVALCGKVAPGRFVHFNPALRDLAHGLSVAAQ